MKGCVNGLFNDEEIWELVECSRISHKRFRKSHTLNDISAAIATIKSLLGIVQGRDESLQLTALRHLGQFFKERFDSFGDMEDLAQSISAEQMAVRLTPAGAAGLLALLDSLGYSLLLRFGRTDDLADITEAISVVSQALQLTPEDEVNSKLHDLGVLFWLRFQHSGELQDIEQ
jgi:hypothetical protein